MDDLKTRVDKALSKYSPTTIVAGTAAACVVGYLAAQVLADPQAAKKKVIASLFGALKSIPGVSGKIDEENAKVVAKLTHELAMKNDEHQMKVIPQKGLSEEEIVAYMQKFVEKEKVGWSEGKVSGKVYNGREEITRLINTIYSMYSVSNALHPDVFPSVRKCESEIIRMTANMLHGDDKVVGATTSGGTESILMAMKVYREAAKARGISHAEVIMGVSAHPAFDKAGHYFGIKVTRVPSGPDFKTDVRALERAISSNTIAVVASAPSYPHGTIDDVAAIAKVAGEKGIYCHVDCCLGGFVLPWAKMAGFDIPDFDFTVPNVSSISCDTHKYGYGPKGLSVVLFKNKELRKGMYYVTTEWPGGIYASAGVSGSRPGAPIAATWAVMVRLGQEGYIEAAKGIMDTAAKIKEGLKTIPEVSLIGDSRSTVLGFTSTKVDMFMVADAMKKRKWVLDVLQRPNGFHICLTVRHIGKQDNFLNDLRLSVAEAMQNPESFKHGMAPIYGMAAELPDRAIVSDFVTAYIDAQLDTI